LIEEAGVFDEICSRLKALTLESSHSYCPAAGDSFLSRLSSGISRGIPQQIHCLVTLAQMPAYAFERMEQ
jgi:hypothetical protein